MEAPFGRQQMGRRALPAGEGSASSEEVEAPRPRSESHVRLLPGDPRDRADCVSALGAAVEAPPASAAQAGMCCLQYKVFFPIFTGLGEVNNTSFLSIAFSTLP